MALMRWTENLSVGVTALDDQHKVLVESLNELHAAMMRGDAKESTGPLLAKLLDYTRRHFSAEEAFLTRTNYPKFADHCKEHKDLTRKVEEFATRYERGELSINVHLLNFLRDWLTNHIQKEDKSYGPWLNSKGVQ